MNKKLARRFLRKNHWNFAPTKFESLSESKQKNLVKMKEKAEKILKEGGDK